MSADLRRRCLNAAYSRMFLGLLPMAAALWLAFQGRPLKALLLFASVLTAFTVGTLVPRCGMFGPMIKRLPSGGRRVLLTIDDGPHPEHTPAILDILDQHGIKAVFFLIGERAAKHPELVKEIVRRGHEVGNHTQTHPATKFWSLHPVQMWREIADCQQTLTEICPEKPPRFFRPPAGHHNLFSFVVSRFLGLRMLMWNARGFDGVLTDVNAIVERIRNRLKPGAIVLIHEATPVAIEVAREVSQLIAESGLESHTPPSALAFCNNEVIIEGRTTP